VSEPSDDASQRAARGTGRREFPTTRWSLIGRAAAPTEAGRRALTDVVRAYQAALRAHLRQVRRLGADQADDVLQSFLADKVIERQILASADPRRGKFRTFLLTALDRFVIDRERADARARRRPSRGRTVEHIDDVDEPAEGVAPPQIFDRVWAQHVIGEALRLTRDECHASGRPHLWGIFESRIVLPATDGLPPAPHDELARTWQLEDAAESANLLTTAKRMFVRHFRAVVSDYLASPEQVDQEIDELWAIFESPRA
jgi:RNA polymerase sigma-70 factor (ECF subfamily)